MIRALFTGGLGFATVSVIAFSVWAFGGRWFRFPGGELAMYAVIAVVFLGLTGLVLGRLVQGPRAMSRFYSAFLPAFFAYAVLWCAAWFIVKGRPGEWLGSIAGSLAFAAVIHWRMRSSAGLWLSALILTITHTAGYFIGSEWMYRVLDHGIAGLAKAQVGLVAKLGWGLFYGLGFGAGIGATFHRAQLDGESNHDVTSSSERS